MKVFHDNWATAWQLGHWQLGNSRTTGQLQLSTRQLGNWPLSNSNWENDNLATDNNIGNSDNWVHINP